MCLKIAWVNTSGLMISVPYNLGFAGGSVHLIPAADGAPVTLCCSSGPRRVAQKIRENVSQEHDAAAVHVREEALPNKQHHASGMRSRSRSQSRSRSRSRRGRPILPGIGAGAGAV